MTWQRISQTCLTRPKPPSAVRDTQWESLLRYAQQRINGNWDQCTPLQQSMVNAMYRAGRDEQGRVRDAHMQAFLTEVRYFTEEYLIEESEVDRWWNQWWYNCKMHPTPCLEWCSTARCKHGTNCSNVHPLVQNLGVGQKYKLKRFRGCNKAVSDEHYSVKKWHETIAAYESRN